MEAWVPPQYHINLTWWCVLVIPAFEKRGQEAQEFKAILSYIERPTCAT